jgi:hypothetical protein
VSEPTFYCFFFKSKHIRVPETCQHYLITYFNKGLRTFRVQTSRSLCLTPLWSLTESRVRCSCAPFLRIRPPPNPPPQAYESCQPPLTFAVVILVGPSTLFPSILSLFCLFAFSCSLVFLMHAHSFSYFNWPFSFPFKSFLPRKDFSLERQKTKKNC